MSPHLRPVTDTDQPAPPVTDSGIPHFEGQPVESALIKLAAVSKLDAGAGWSRIDDTVRMYVEGRVVGVHHSVDEPTGKLMRVHTIKVVDAIQLPWDFDAGQFES
jgi:hypothetical protein